MEALFDCVSRHLDVRARISIFNKKLDYANEIAEGEQFIGLDSAENTFP